MGIVTQESTTSGRFVSLRTLLIVRFVAMSAVITVALALMFYVWIAPMVVGVIETKVREALTDAGVSRETTDTLIRENAHRYSDDIGSRIRRNGLAIAGLYFVFGFVATYGITTVGTRQMRTLTEAARAITRGEYKQDLSRLYRGPVRSEISELAQAIEESGRVHIREKVLIEKVRELEIKIDESKKQQQVDEIVDSEYFQDLRAKAKSMRKSSEAKPQDEA